MSSSIQSHPNASGLFQTHFGTLPGSQDAKAECEKWQRLCEELLAERARLRADLEKAKLDEICREPIPSLTMAEVYAQVDRTTTLEQIIADLKSELESER